MPSKLKGENPLISICILNHNGENRLSKSIPSILSQKYNNLEILFLDNGSTDKSLDYIKQFKLIRVIRNDRNLGISTGRNILAKESKGKYILFLDNDIELTRHDFLDKILINYQSLKNKNIGVIFPLSIMENEKIYCNVGLYFNRLQKIKFKDIYQTGFILKPGFEGSAFFIKKSIFMSLGGFDEKYPICMNDSDLSMRLYNMGYKIFADTTLFTIHHGADARTSIKTIGWKYKYYFAALMRSIIKNYKITNLLKWGFISGGWIIFKSFKLSIQYKSILPIKGQILSIITFFKDLPDTLKQREYRQNNRKIDYDYFLKIK